MAMTPCPMCSSPRLLVTTSRECTLIEEVVMDDGRPIVTSQRLAAAGRHLLPARAECARCGHSWWVAVPAPLRAATHSFAGV